MTTFDYVIVGGGSAGCVLASRLSEDPTKTVCLLEAGGEGKNWFVRVPFGGIVQIPGYFKINNWAFDTVPQAGLNGRKGYQPRGKALGGSSAINAMLYVRGTPGDYDRWAQEEGARGWGWNDVLPYFKRSEGNARGADDLHGNDGPLQVTDPMGAQPINQAFIEAAGELQIPHNPDFNGSAQEGVGLFQVKQFFDGPKRGQRCSAAAAYLHPHMDRRENLHIMTGAQALRLELDLQRVVGIWVRHRGQDKLIEASREVVLSSGAFGTPQILQLSGIGDGDDLRAHGIHVQHELLGVGKNLSDHLDVTIGEHSDDANLVGVGIKGTGFVLRGLQQWLSGQRGILSSTFAEAGGFVKTQPDLTDPDIQYHFVIALVEDHLRKLVFGQGYSLHTCLLRPFSRGTVGLNSANPQAPPRIDPNFLSDPRDLPIMIKGARMGREIMRAQALEPYRRKEWRSFDNMSDSDWEALIREKSDSVYHPVGTAKIGAADDNSAVVDPNLKVRGLEGLRVADASVMPSLIGGNTNAPTIMIGEKAADLIKAEAA